MREQVLEFVVPAFALIGVVFWVKYTFLLVANKTLDFISWARRRRVES